MITVDSKLREARPQLGALEVLVWFKLDLMYGIILYKRRILCLLSLLSLHQHRSDYVT